MKVFEKPLLFLGLFLMTAGPVLAADIHVPGDYPTISEAIAAALPGDRVLVDRGTYEEDIEMKDRVDVIGAGSGLCTIRGPGAFCTVLFPEECAAALKGFRIEGAGRVGVYASLESSPTLEKNLVTGFSGPAGAGVDIYGARSAVAARNRVESCGTGIDLGCDEDTSLGALVEDNAIVNCENGISVGIWPFWSGQPTGWAKVVVRRNLIQDSSYGGIIFHYAYPSVLNLWLEVTSNRVFSSGRTGIDLTLGADKSSRPAPIDINLVVRNNLVIDSGSGPWGAPSGIALITTWANSLPGSQCLIENNTVTSAATTTSPAGIFYNNAYDPELRGRVANNIVVRCGGTGIDGLCYPTSDNPLILCNDVFQNEGGNYSPEIGDRTGRDGNVSQDPLFVRGYCLAQFATGHQLQSVCVDAGIEVPTMSELSTRTDDVPDELPVDLGWHHAPLLSVTEKKIFRSLSQRRSGQSASLSSSLFSHHESAGAKP